jgi:hypothetical protein
VRPTAQFKGTARTFTAGAGIGFIAGAFLVSAIVWQYGNVIGTRAARQQHPTMVPSPIDRWKDVIDDVGDPVIRPRDAARPVGTTGASPDVVTPPPSPEPVLAAPPAAELEARDLLIPVEGIAEKDLARSFADSRGGRLHEAIDILAPQHTPVKAVEDGKIARLFLSKAGGITIYQFDPTERFCYYYAHLDRYAEGMVEGQQVKKGQVLGYVGVSGNAPKNTPHLHFAIFRLSEAKRWWEGTPIDPYDVLK